MVNCSLGDDLTKMQKLYCKIKAEQKCKSVKDYLANKTYGKAKDDNQAKEFADEFKLLDYLNAGFLTEEGDNLIIDETKEQPIPPLVVYSDSDLQNYEPEPLEWLIENQIPKGSIGLLVGKRGERKTFTALAQALSVASGKPLFNDNVPKKRKVLILDEENGKRSIAQRVKMMKLGMNINEPLEIKFISFSGIKINEKTSEAFPNEKFVHLKRLIRYWKPDLIIIDCLSRVVSLDIDKGNSEVSGFFSGIVRPITETYGCSWLFIHHLRKGGNTRMGSDDELDDIRGASELVNYCRFVLKCEVPKNQLNDDGTELMLFKVLKMSDALKSEAKVVSFSFDDNKIEIKYLGKPEEVLAGEVQCANAIKNWIFRNGIREFETKDVQNTSEIPYKKTLTASALKYLLEEKFIIKIKRGQYVLSDKINFDDKIR